MSILRLFFKDISSELVFVSQKHGFRTDGYVMGNNVGGMIESKPEMNIYKKMSIIYSLD